YSPVATCPVSVSQLLLVRLADWREGKTVDVLDRLRGVYRAFSFADQSNKLLGLDTAAGTEHYQGFDGFAPFFVRNPYRRGSGHRRMFAQDVFDLPGKNVEPS